MSKLASPIIENHNRKIRYYPVRKFVYQLVTKDNPPNLIHGRFLYKSSPMNKDRGFYHVSVYDLSKPWWRIPTVIEQTLLKARYGDDLQF